MKKFIVNFMIGIVLMAIGTTALIFGLNDFDYVDSATYALQNENYTSEKIPLKANETLEIDFMNNIMHSYEWAYDDTLKDSVKISFANGVNYRINARQVEILAIDYTQENDGSAWKQFQFILDGLKQHKIYSINDAKIIITTSHTNRKQVIVNNYNE